MLMTACILCACEQHTNPLLTSSELPYGAPPFSQIKSSDYLPAFEEGFKQHKKEIDAIASNPEEPTFANTIDALEKSGQLLARVEGIFYNINETDADDVMKETEKKITPIATDHSAYITMNEQLFARIKALYDKKDSLQLTREQEMVLDKYYRRFVRGGALLNSEQKKRLIEIDKQLSLATIQFGDNSLAETNAFTLLINNEADLAGLPEDIKSAASERAQAAGKKGWLFTLQKPSWEPFLKYADNRELRKKMYLAYIHRGDNNNNNDNKELIKKILELRLEKAQLFGYDNFDAYQLDDKMAKTPQAAYDMLMQIWKPAIAKAQEERDDLQKMMNESGIEGQLEAWDWWYYAEKLRKKRFALDEAQLKPYFSLENVRKGAFLVANRLFGVSFQPLKLAGTTDAQTESSPNVPDVYHPEVSCFEVQDSTGKHLALYYTDYFPRSTKRAGAWMNNIVEAIHLDSMDQDPMIVNVCNFTPATATTPSLLNLDETRTLFHEFGHATHGYLTQCHYPTVSGTSVARDFVELPSQIMEHWAIEPCVLKQYALHYKTGEPIPDSLISKMQAAGTFNTGFETTELVAASLLDMEFHMQDNYKDFDAVKFEKAVADKLGLIPQIAFRYRGPYFNHIFAGGYAAGYYSYLWAEVLDADGFEAFKESGDVLNASIGRSFRTNILEKGGSDDPMTLYKNFRGSEPHPDALLRNRGLK